jgi:hypothetical protein
MQYPTRKKYPNQKDLFLLIQAKRKSSKRQFDDRDLVEERRRDTIKQQTKNVPSGGPRSIPQKISPTRLFIRNILDAT